MKVLTALCDRCRHRDGETSNAAEHRDLKVTLPDGQSYVLDLCQEDCENWFAPFVKELAMIASLDTDPGRFTKKKRS